MSLIFFQFERTHSETTMELSFLFSLVLPILFTLVLIKKLLQPKPPLDPNLPPGPKRLPIIGNLLHLLGDQPHRALHRLANTYGPLMLLRLGQVDFVVATSSEAAREILKTYDLHFVDRPENIALKIVMYGPSDVAFSPYGAYWRYIRKIFILEVLSASRVKSCSSHRQEEILKLVDDINAGTAASSKMVDLRSKISSLINIIAARSAFGQWCEHFQRFLSVVKPVSELVSGFSIADTFPNVKYIEVVTGLKFKAERLRRQVDGVLEQIIEEHKMKRSRDQEGPQEEDFVDVLLRIKDTGEFPITDENIKAVLLDLFLGGSDSSSSLIEWAMAELIKNPHCMEKAQTELRQVLKRKARIEEDDLEGLHYFKLVIRETLRLHPSVPMLIPRQCINMCQVNGYKVNAGTRVIVNAWALARDPRYWEDPDRFNPERFNGSSVDFKGLNFEYLPFGAGRRMCPGMAFALASVHLTLAYLLSYFNWELPNGMKPEDLDMTESFGLSMRRKTALCLLATPYVPGEF